MDRLVEDLIQESMSRGEFDNLAGSGKPLKHQASNPYVDFITHKMNQVNECAVHSLAAMDIIVMCCEILQSCGRHSAHTHTSVHP